MLTFLWPSPPNQSYYSRSTSLTTSFFSDTLRSVTSNLSTLSFHPHPKQSLIIRMGGGPRTFPGGVSKWQWKRMQAKKAKQLLKARLCRERQIYEMRKRAELKAAVSELERPWEVVERAPNLFSVRADEQLKVLADRFQKAGGFDMWTENDGPQLFDPVEGLPSTRFFPKGVVHSIKPYAKFEDVDDDGLIGEGLEVGRNDYDAALRRRRRLKGVSNEDKNLVYEEDALGGDNALKLDVSSVGRKSKRNSSLKDGKKLNGRTDRPFVPDEMKAAKNSTVSNRGTDYGNGHRQIDSGNGKRGDSKRTGHKKEFHGLNRSGTGKSFKSMSDVHDMSLQQDGSYGF